MISNYSKIFGASLLTVLIPLGVNGASAVGDDPYFLTRLLENGVIIFGIFIIFATVVFLFRFFMIWMDVQKMRILEEQGLEVLKESTLVKDSLWSRMMKRLSGAVPVEREADVMLDHNYDGIRELDNSLPPWWVAMFYITVAIGVVYMGYYHYPGTGKGSIEEYELEMAYAERQKALFLERQANAVNEKNVEMITDEKLLLAGQTIFKESCANCHGQLGEGLVGPNLTDNYWLHGGDIKSVFKTIKYGVPDKGMIAWSTQMSASSMHQVASYILTLVGTDPPNQKEKQGDLYEPGKGEG